METHVPSNSRETRRVSHNPEYFPLPSRGQDPHFGLGRSTYYDLERRGLLNLVRVRKPGNVRGKVLIPYAETGALIRSMSKAGRSTPIVSL